MNKLIFSFFLILTGVSAESATLHCAANENDIAKINPLDADAAGFWHLDIPKKFEIETERGRVMRITYKFSDQVQEEGIVDSLAYVSAIKFKDSFIDLGKRDKLTKGFHSSKVSENSKEASIKIRSKFKKWGMDNDGVNKLWKLTLDKSNLTGKIEATNKFSFFNNLKLETRFSCK